ncbi:single-stranded-DNA-specific exonuclease RecJ [Siminovitchia terrae]|uniref:Single-stranded-DNA-specific exonuclease RecJ n=1 Tax=Siminovitchia terrae TaxID=1914933 RepID=A0ABQ4L1B3_SIMTE|nr:single-stranded-DNA-specific exonuclease RecJ [Siminovitchia terrae]GIN89734.1 single-stranded-DNA-specific exonuclease RecJ [Siminovitchia terrae]GIN97971.1 single-stranded-DNA-specific exonuclease RecJ [Siminovitchia terrae]
MLQSNTRWIVRKADEKAVQILSGELDISPLTATLLLNRGISDPAEAYRFLHIEKEDFHDPFLMQDMNKAVERIRRAIDEQEKILVYGDYDADGVTSTTVLMTVLRELGASVEFYIPNRFTEGYGPNENAFRQAAHNGVKLIITVDTGIASVHEAEIAKQLGMDLIITDHHEIRPEVPSGYAIIHPRYGDTLYPFPDLAGVGVTFKLAHALYGSVPDSLLDLVAVGTIADLVPLHGENRLIVKKGLRVLSRSERPGLLALSKQAGVNLVEANEETVGFTIAPRLNAAGRLYSADPAAELLLSKDQETAEMLANDIEQLNNERKDIVAEITKEAMEMVEALYPPSENHVLVIGKEGWNPGVIGIVASRLTEKYYRPAIVLGYDEETGKAKGSARSIKGFDLFANLLTCADLMEHFGGHPMAAGMTLSISKVDELRKRLEAVAQEQLSEEDLIPFTDLDAEALLAEVDLDSIKELDKLAPYGVSNPKPKFMIKDADPQDIRKIGTNQNHLKLTLKQAGGLLDGIGFNLGYIADSISPDAKLSVIGELAINEWNNIRKPQIFIRDACINSWQLFDMRGNKRPDTWLPLLPKKNVHFVVFNRQTLDEFPLDASPSDVKLILDFQKAKELIIDGKSIVFLDIPPNLSLLEALIEGKSPNRIYAHFSHDQAQFFKTIPTREHFKWYYAFLAKRRTFDVRKFGKELEAHRGWSTETVQFMTQVFFELEFVTIKEGVIALNQVKMKKDLSDSPAYQQKQAGIELENVLVYSSYQELKQWFEKRVAHPVYHEEEVDAWT